MTTTNQDDADVYDFETEGRANKAGHLARAVLRRGIPINVAQSWNADQWQALAEREGLKKPSAKTIAMALGFVESRLDR